MPGRSWERGVVFFRGVRSRAAMHILSFILIGLFVGTISGTLGIGGGVLLMPLLVWLFNHEQLKAAGVTLAVLAVPVVLPAVGRYFAAGIITGSDLVIAAWIALGFALGGWCGAYIAPYFPLPVLRFLFGLMLLYIAIRFLMGSSPEATTALVALVSLALALVGYWWLRLLGRRHLAKPNLGNFMRPLSRPRPGEPDYHI